MPDDAVVFGRHGGEGTFDIEFVRTAICDAVGISADEVIRSGRLGYSRTGLPRPGPVGGPCLSKDSHILCESLEPYGVDPQITRVARRFNELVPVKRGREIADLAREVE